MLNMNKIVQKTQQAGQPPQGGFYSTKNLQQPTQGAPLTPQVTIQPVSSYPPPSFESTESLSPDALSRSIGEEELKATLQLVKADVNRMKALADATVTLKPHELLDLQLKFYVLGMKRELPREWEDQCTRAGQIREREEILYRLQQELEILKSGGVL